MKRDNADKDETPKSVVLAQEVKRRMSTMNKERSDPGIEDQPANNDEKLVENINEDPDDINTPKDKPPEQGVDNIDEEDELREDMKGDPLGGSTQVDGKPARQRGGG